MPLSDFLRIAVTASHTDPDTPLAAADLLALTHDSAQARAFVDRYLLLTGKERANLLHILANPEAARTELAELLSDFAAGCFAGLEPQLVHARERAGERLAKIAGTLRPTWPEWIAPYAAQLEGFSPVVLAASAFLDHYVSVYYHEIREPLFDGTSYEPFIIAIGERRLLRPQPLRSRQRTAVSGLPADPALRCCATFAAVADPSRLRLVQLLAERPRYGQELAQELEMSAPTISHHLSLLLTAGLVTIERQAHRTYYALETELLAQRLREGEAFMLRGGAADPQQTRQSNR
jgi:DNA-binding transcriptional ArsR family regulator